MSADVAMAGDTDDDYADDFLNMMGGLAKTFGGKGGPPKKDKSARREGVSEKGEAMDHLIYLMKGQEETRILANVQGEDVTYHEAAKRLDEAPYLDAYKVDEPTYNTVNNMLSTLAEQKEHPKFNDMPAVVEAASKFLAAPLPETHEEKRHELAKWMAAKRDNHLDQHGIYKMTHKEGGHEVKNAPVGVTQSSDPEKQKELEEKMTAVLPSSNKKLQEVLKDTITEGAIHIGEVTKGRGEAVQAIHDELKKDASQEFLEAGKFKKAHGGVADMLAEAPFLGGKMPAQELFDKVHDKIHTLPVTGLSEVGQKHFGGAKELAAEYVAGTATEESGLYPNGVGPRAGGGFYGGGGLGRAGGADGAGADGAGAGGAGAGGAGAGGAGAGGAGAGGADAGGAGAGGASGANGLGADGALATSEGSEAGGKGGKGKDGKDGLGGPSDDDDDTPEGRLRKRKREEEAENERKRAARRKMGEGSDDDPERAAADKILHKELRAKGNETFYKQPPTDLTHVQASEWLSQTPKPKVDKSVRESFDTDRLHMKFEKKLSGLVKNNTPENMRDAMQDVVIEKSRTLSELFVANNYKALVSDGLISEMQNRGNEILVDVDGATETSFFAAQRLKKAKTLDTKEPCDKLSYPINKKLDEVARHHAMPRKLASTMKEHVKGVSDYLSEHVTKPDQQIEAYVDLLNEMESAGSALLIEGDIPKSYKKSASYLRQLTSYEDKINRPNSALQSATEAKLHTLMKDVPKRGYSGSVLNSVITDSTKLLVSHVMLQGERTKLLKMLVDRLDEAGQLVLLRHGSLRKTCADGAALLRGKNADQLEVDSPDPVVSRKIHVKLRTLMANTPLRYQDLLDDIIDDATNYLAVHLLQARVIQVCKCMNNVFVQCELWCEEILRRVTKPCCTCSRHVSAQALADLLPGVDVTLTTCPYPHDKPCPAPKPSPACPSQQHTYMLYSTRLNQRFGATTLHESDCVNSPSCATANSLFGRSDLSYRLSFEKLRPSPVFERRTSPSLGFERRERPVCPRTKVQTRSTPQKLERYDSTGLPRFERNASDYPRHHDERQLILDPPVAGHHVERYETESRLDFERYKASSPPRDERCETTNPWKRSPLLHANTRQSVSVVRPKAPVPLIPRKPRILSPKRAKSRESSSPTLSKPPVTWSPIQNKRCESGSLHSSPHRESSVPISFKRCASASSHRRETSSDLTSKQCELSNVRSPERREQSPLRYQMQDLFEISNLPRSLTFGLEDKSSLVLPDCYVSHNPPNRESHNRLSPHLNRNKLNATTESPTSPHPLLGNTTLGMIDESRRKRCSRRATEQTSSTSRMPWRQSESGYNVRSLIHEVSTSETCHECITPGHTSSSSSLPALTAPSPPVPTHPSPEHSPTTNTEICTDSATVSTAQMCDWQAMMVSLVWNVKAWRHWVQDNFNRAFNYRHNSNITADEAEKKWYEYQRTIEVEALQWRQYNIFSRLLTQRLGIRYKNKNIMSTEPATDVTAAYLKCQHDMLQIVEIFNRWTKWLCDIVKEANSITPQDRDSDEPLHDLRWYFLKSKVEESLEEWKKHKQHLKTCWEHKYSQLISGGAASSKSGPVWVMSACGAVPSGAVPAGVLDGEVTWLARTTHRCKVLPGALHPSKHCCIVYADGAVHHYTKYQVMCNARVTWRAWRACCARVTMRAVRAAQDVLVGRVLYRGEHLVGAVFAPHYRCSVVIFGRPFTFNCYELLVLADDE